MNKKQTVTTVWEVWHYDVWGNAEDGYEVNDRSCHNRNCVIECEVKTYNAGTPNEFISASPTDKQIKDALGIIPQVKISTDEGDDTSIYVRRIRDSWDSYPLGEMLCVSHDSLSPIRASNNTPEIRHDALTDAITNAYSY